MSGNDYALAPGLGLGKSASTSYSRPPRDLGDLALWKRSAKWAQERRLTVAQQRQRERKRRKIAMVMSFALVGGSGGTITSAALAEDATAAATSTNDAAPRTVRFGDRGAAVKRLQSNLGVAADGVFGKKTKSAVRSYQRQKGLAVDGIAGSQTWSALLGRTVQTTAASKKSPKVRKRMAGLSTASAGEQVTTDGATSGSGSSIGTAALAAARTAIGTPYSWGGTSTSGFDCSGLTQWAFRKAGKTLPRTSQAQFGSGTSVSRANIKAGDLVFFSTYASGASHVGIATSATTAVSATSSGGVRTHSIFDSYWGSRYVGARRV